MAADHIYNGLNDLRGQIPALHEAITPGTPRRWMQRDLTDAARTRADEQARAEREAKEINAARGITTSGTGRAPLRIDVLDALDAIEHGLIDVEVRVCERLGLTPLTRFDSRQRIARLVVLLGRISGLPDLAEDVLDDINRMSATAARALGDSERIHRIDARCPICTCLSLRAFPERERVICVNNYCRCTEGGCPCQDEFPSRHSWHWVEWPQLAKMLDDRETA